MHPLIKLTGLCSILMAIILFCVIVGGYTSLSRSQARIQSSKSLLTDACQKRQDLLPKLIETISKTDQKDLAVQLGNSALKADAVLNQFISHEPPAEKHLVKEFEISQSALSQQLITIFTSLKPGKGPSPVQELSDLKKEFSAVQDYLFVVKKRYNNEVEYFNRRSNVFPGFIIAKIFGLDHIVYTEISKDKFLSGEKTYTRSKS